MTDFEELKRISQMPGWKQREIFAKPKKPTFEEEMITNASESLVKTLEAISPEVSEQACIQYLTNRNYSVVKDNVGG